MKPGIKNLHLDAAYPMRVRRQLLPRVLRNRRVDAVTGRDAGPGRFVAAQSFLSLAFSVARGATAAVLILLLLLVQARAFAAFEAHVVNVTAEIHQINAPEASPPGGIFEESVSVSLSVIDPTDGPLSIHFTLVSLDPNCTSTEYLTPILISEDTTLKAIACDGAGHKSIITEEDYIIESPPPEVGGPSADGFLSLAGESEISEEPAAPTSTPPLPSFLEFPGDLLPPTPTSTPTTTPDLPPFPQIPEIADLFDDFPVPTSTPTTTLPELPPLTPTSTLPELPSPPEPPNIEIDKPQPPDLPLPPEPPDPPELPDLTDKLKPPEPPELPEIPSFPEL